jgi:peptidoglycan/xylan/chitin deacetylase (PgdA/CDA1 family)
MAVTAAIATLPGPVVQARTTQGLVPWHGPVEHLFFHPLVTDPGRTFHAPDAKDWKDYFVTVQEFTRIVGSLYRKGWVLVDIHAAVSGHLMVPAHRRPIVISIDDLNYTDWMQAAGLAWRMVLDPQGRIAVEVRDRHGKHPRISRTDDIVPILDDFVRLHPDFSVDGAKGVIGETGTEGVLGERTNARKTPGWAQRVARAKAMVAVLKATGWTFASHSYAHPDLSLVSLDTTIRDSRRWRNEVEPIIGSTDVYLYPYGSVPTLAVRLVLHRRFGFRIFGSIDVIPGAIHDHGMIEMYRRHIDGISFRDEVKALRPFFDVSKVIDARNRG